ncbi:MAG: hypothetical protein HOH58_14410 [Opitutaceae bacterium]|nr:hypothetical protein [Opitutaceae bacterium]
MAARHGLGLPVAESYGSTYPVAPSPLRFVEPRFSPLRSAILKMAARHGFEP